MKVQVFAATRGRRQGRKRAGGRLVQSQLSTTLPFGVAAAAAVAVTMEATNKSYTCRLSGGGVWECATSHATQRWVACEAPSLSAKGQRDKEASKSKLLCSAWRLCGVLFQPPSLSKWSSVPIILNNQSSLTMKPGVWNSAAFHDLAEAGNIVGKVEKSLSYECNSVLACTWFCIGM